MNDRHPSAEGEHFRSADEWERWLGANHARSTGLWLRVAKKGSSAVSVSYAEALEVALLFGWIDGQKRKLDDRFWLQRFTPRGPRSRWSKKNRASAIELVKAGRMRQAGLDEIDRAKADGRWDAAYESQSRATIPPDLRRALDANERAAAFFETLDGHNRYAILYRVHDAKRPDTRAKRIATYTEMLARGETLHPSTTARARRRDTPSRTSARRRR
jgi:uncharacterized protein YdeI (YjbR/CyaY-like superfamily)